MTDESRPSPIQRLLDGLAEKYADFQLEQIARCLFLQPRDVQKRRLRAIMDLSAERQRLLNEHGRCPERPNLPQGFQGSAFMAMTIEHLINGNFDAVRSCADLYLFEGEGEWAQEWIEVYVKFRAMAHAAIAEPEDVQ